jgi:hypothetical protein
MATTCLSQALRRARVVLHYRAAPGRYGGTLAGNSIACGVPVRRIATSNPCGSCNLSSCRMARDVFHISKLVVPDVYDHIVKVVVSWTAPTT